MTPEDLEQRTGGIPHAFGNQVAWKWADEMPAYLKRGFLTMLYAMRQHAAPSGDLVFNNGDRQPIKLSVLARSAGCREKDGRRYIDAALRAGVLAVVGERRRGKATLYRLVVTPWPDWKAAEEYLRGTSRAAGKRFVIEEDVEEVATPEVPETSGHGGPNVIDDPEPDTARATVAPTGSGHGGPNGSGHRGPDIPCVTQAVHHDGAEVVTQPAVVGGPADEKTESPSSEETAESTGAPFGRCEVCRTPLLRAGTRCSAHREDTPGRRRPSQRRSGPIQPPLMSVVPAAPAAAPAPAEGPQEATAGFFPERVCGCGRTYRKPGPVCPLCKDVQQAEAERLTASTPVPHQKASNA